MQTSISESPNHLDVKSISGALSIDEAKGIVECFVAAIGNKDSVGDIIVPGAFEASLRKRRPRVVWGHDWNQPIGKVLDIFEVPAYDKRLPPKLREAGVGGLYVRMQINLKSERGREAFASILFFGDEQEYSIGYKTLDSIYDNGKQANILREIELYEVSPVLHGANQLTATLSIKSESQDRLKSFRSSQWKMFDPEFAEMIRREHPEIWRLGGNIKGNDQFRKLYPITQRNGVANSDAEISALELREAWVARHSKNFRLPGVIAQIKWLAVGSRGESYMKDLVREAIADKEKPDEKGMSITPAMLMRAIEALREAEDEDEDDEGQEDENGGAEQEKGTGPCWPGYEMIGMKPGKDGQMVPNCVPIKSGDSGVSEMKAPLPPDAIPQERFTGDVMRGRGPRRGNLERLLRYWRPIMRREGGFRRCRVILANHPELYPLENICAWLHHETTGLWPNEGCHHPGMKNCRRKLRGVVRGSIWNDDEWDNRLRRLAGKGDNWPNGAEVENEDPEEIITDEDIRYANAVLAEFMKEEEDFVKWLSDESNWEHEGMDDGDEWQPHELKKPEGCGCGCSGMKSDEQQQKAGRVLNSGNMAKLQQALGLLQEVIASSAQPAMTIKHVAAMSQEIKTLLAPIEEFYGLSLDVRDLSVSLPEDIDHEAKSAIEAALDTFSDEADYIIVDVEPEDMFHVKQLLDGAGLGENTVIDESEGKWIAVGLIGQSQDALVKTLHDGQAQIKGIAYGELERN
jgi:HK97 family phage prohead protease